MILYIIFFHYFFLFFFLIFFFQNSHEQKNSQELQSLKDSLKDTEPIGSIVSAARTLEQVSLKLYCQIDWIGKSSIDFCGSHF